MSLKYYFNVLREFEDANNLFFREIAGVRFWDMMRFPLFQRVIIEKSVYEQRPAQKSEKSAPLSVQDKILNIWKRLQHEPFFSNKKDFLFFGPGLARRRIGIDETLWDIYCDPLIDQLGADRCLLLEAWNHTLNGTQKCHTENRAHSNRFAGVAKILSKTRFGNVIINKQEELIIEEFESDFCRLFGFRVDFLGWILSILARHKQYGAVYKLFLSIKKPKAVFVVCSYGAETLVDACRQLNIPSLEIQHGTISSYEVGYSYPTVGSKKYFPDFFLSMGKYWEECVALPIEQSKIMTLGNPFVTITRENHSCIKKKQIVVVSQWPIGKAISRFAVELSNRLGSSYSIMYKLHPLENNDWKTKYPWLHGSLINVVSNGEESLENLFADSEFQIGVFSTALFEGLTYGCKTFVVDLPGIEHVEALIERGYVKLVRNVEEVNLEDSFEKSFDEEYFFSNDWRNNLTQLKNQLSL